MSNEVRFDELNGLNWKESFNDPCTKDWREKWFLDGERATITHSEEGMVLSAGPVARDHASHCVLWTQESFEGDVKIEFEYWRLDTIERHVNIIYILATGVGDGPYVKDIAAWSDLRTIPYMRTYYNNMKLLHISFAAFDNEDNDDPDYVRARQYPVTEKRRFNELDIPPDNFDTGLFAPGVHHKFTVIKRAHDLVMRVETEEKTSVFAWDTSDFPEVTEGRIGLRHMWTRCSRYKDFRVSVLGD